MDVDVPSDMNEEYLAAAKEAGDDVSLIMRSNRDHYEIVGPHLTNSFEDFDYLARVMNDITHKSFLHQDSFLP